MKSFSCPVWSTARSRTPTCTYTCRAETLRPGKSPAPSPRTRRSPGRHPAAHGQVPAPETRPDGDVGRPSQRQKPADRGLGAGVHYDGRQHDDGPARPRAHQRRELGPRPSAVAGDGVVGVGALLKVQQEAERATGRSATGRPSRSSASQSMPTNGSHWRWTAPRRATHHRSCRC